MLILTKTMAARTLFNSMMVQAHTTHYFGLICLIMAHLLWHLPLYHYSAQMELMPKVFLTKNKASNCNEASVTWTPTPTAHGAPFHNLGHVEEATWCDIFTQLHECSQHSNNIKVI